MKYIFFGLCVGIIAWATVKPKLNDTGSIEFSPEGRLSVRSHISNQSSAIDVWPTTGTYPTNNSVAEITLHKTTGANLEQMNFSVTPDGQYRFGVEREGTGQFYDIVFCYENYTSGVADCLFKITTEGIFVNNFTSPEQRNWVKLGGRQ